MQAGRQMRSDSSAVEMFTCSTLCRSLCDGTNPQEAFRRRWYIIYHVFASITEWQGNNLAKTNFKYTDEVRLVLFFFFCVFTSVVPFLSLSFRTRMRTRLRSASELFRMDPLKETSGRTTRKCTSTWWSTIRLGSRMLSLASNQGNCSAIQSHSTKHLPVSHWRTLLSAHLRACLRAYVCVHVCDSSSETEDEWSSSLGTARAIFSSALYKGAGDGGGL